MSNIDKLNRLRSFYNRNRLLSNANELISASIKKQLNDIEADSNSGDSDRNSNVTSYNPEEFGHFDVYNNASGQEDYEHDTSSEDSEDEESESEYDSDSETESSDSDSCTEDSVEVDNRSDLGKVEIVNKNELESTDEPYLVKNEKIVDASAFESNKKTATNDLDPEILFKSEPDNEYLKNVFINLEKQLSDVRLGYQASLSSCSLESSCLKQDLRRSASMSSLKPTSSVNTSANNTSTNEPTNKAPDLDSNIPKAPSHLSKNYSIGSNSSLNTSKSYFNQATDQSNRDGGFNLNKWLDELPAGLRNFVEIESAKVSTDRNSSNRGNDPTDSSMAKLHTNSQNNGTRLEEPRSTGTVLVSSNSNTPECMDQNHLESAENKALSIDTPPEANHDKHDSNADAGGYIDKITKDYIKPIQQMFSEDFKNDIKDEIMYFKEDLMYLKDGLVDLYNKSPKVLQNLINQDESESELSTNEKIEKKLMVNPNSYYLQSTRNTDSILSNYLAEKDKHAVKVDNSDNERKETKEPQSSCTVFNIYDKYECFDISDQTKLTHVSSFDINNPNQDYSLTHQEDQGDEDEGKVVTSISEYNIEFLSNLSKVNEKCNMLNTHKISCNLIKPWFTNPINEKIQINTNRSKLSRSSRLKVDEKHVVSNESIKYIIKKSDDKVKYIIDEGSKPNNDQANKKGPINLYDIENYYNQTDYEYHNDGGKRFYDPISHFEKHMDNKKKTINNTEWATFGRPLVKKTKETILK